MSDVFDSVYGQPKVRDFLRSSVRAGRVSHAYLFCGPAGSSKTACAMALAQALVCDGKPNCAEGPCACDACKRVARGSHPDVHVVSPEGAQGYVVEQIRDLVADAQLAPVYGKRKVYILERADTLNAASANAFLKTLEEPPADVTIILMARNREAMLATIVSRCQVVAFRHIPDSEAAGILAQNTGCTLPEARIAISAVGGSLSKAAVFLRSKERGTYRSCVLTALSSLARADDLDVLDYARDIVLASKAPLDAVARDQQEELAQRAEFLQSAAVKRLEAQQKRALSAASMELLRQMCAIVRGWVRDVSVLCAGADDLLVNVDVADAIRDAAGRTSVARCAAALACVDSCERAISYNVSPQVSIEAMLFEIREALYA